MKQNKPRDMRYFLSFVMSVGLSIAVYSQDQVIFCQDCSFFGARTKLSPGRYTLEGTSVGLWNVSSMIIPSGMRVVAYDGFEPGTGQKTSFTGDVRCLTGEWNNRINSVVIEYVSGNAPSGGNQGSNEQPITVYSECFNRGRSTGLSSGYHDINGLGIGNDQISAIRIAPGYSVTIYENANYQGRSTTLTRSVDCLGWEWDNKISSLIVNRNAGGEHHNYDAYNANTGKSGTNGYPLVVFDECYARGASRGLSTGYHDSRDLGVGNDRISTLRIEPGYSVTVFEDAGYRGRSETFYSTQECLTDVWDNKISSLVVNRTGQSEYRADGGAGSTYSEKVALFVDCNMVGFSSTLGPGDYTLSTMGIGDNAVSSIKIPNGWSVTVYENDYFGGRSATFTNSINCLGRDWNERISSIRIQRVR